MPRSSDIMSASSDVPVSIAFITGQLSTPKIMKRLVQVLLHWWHAS